MTKRYWPPTRTSVWQETRAMPSDFGTHHCLSSSAFVQASNTMRAGPLMVRVTTHSRSDLRSIVVGSFFEVDTLSLLASIDFLLLFECFDNPIQLAEAGLPEQAMPLEPRRFFFQSVQAKFAGPHAPDLFGRDESGLFQNADVFHHAREGHLEPVGQVCDGRVRTPDLLQHATSGGVCERVERRIEACRSTLYHLVKCVPRELALCKGRDFDVSEGGATTRVRLLRARSSGPARPKSAPN